MLIERHWKHKNCSCHEQSIGCCDNNFGLQFLD